MSSWRVEGDVAETDAWSDGVDISLDAWTKLSWLQNFQQKYSSSTKFRSSLVDDACGLDKILRPLHPKLYQKNSGLGQLQNLELFLTASLVPA